MCFHPLFLKFRICSTTKVAEASEASTASHFTTVDNVARSVVSSDHASRHLSRPTVEPHVMAKAGGSESFPQEVAMALLVAILVICQGVIRGMPPPSSLGDEADDVAGKVAPLFCIMGALNVVHEPLRKYRLSSRSSSLARHVSLQTTI